MDKTTLGTCNLRKAQHGFQEFLSQSGPSEESCVSQEDGCLRVPTARSHRLGEARRKRAHGGSKPMADSIAAGARGWSRSL